MGTVDSTKKPLAAPQSLATTLRRYLLLSAAMTTCVVLSGAALNNLGHKYARVLQPTVHASTTAADTLTAIVNNNASSTSSSMSVRDGVGMSISGINGEGGPDDICDRAVYTTSDPGSVFCCDGLRRQVRVIY